MSHQECLPRERLARLVVVYDLLGWFQQDAGYEAVAVAQLLALAQTLTASATSAADSGSSGCRAAAVFSFSPAASDRCSNRRGRALAPAVNSAVSRKLRRERV